jgi:uncharacterized protein YcbK (DUF882 family)
MATVFFSSFRGALGIAVISSITATVAAPVFAAPGPTMVGSAAAVAPRTHVVAPGQLLIWLAKRYNVSVEDLRAANGLASGQLVKVGSVLTIPSPSSGSVASGVAAKKNPPLTVPAVYAPPSSTPNKAANMPVVPRGALRMARGADQWQGRVWDGRGRISPGAVAAVSQLLRFGPTGKQTTIEPRLVELLARVSDHFRGRTLRVVSGFRPYSPKQYTPHSRHNKGAAVDFSVDGVPNEVLRDFCKSLRNVGVGYYPNSTFVHLDVRSTFTTWVDYSKPGERPRYAHGNAAEDTEESSSEASEDLLTFRFEGNFPKGTGQQGPIGCFPTGKSKS